LVVAAVVLPLLLVVWGMDSPVPSSGRSLTMARLVGIFVAFLGLVVVAGATLWLSLAALAGYALWRRGVLSGRLATFAFVVLYTRKAVPPLIVMGLGVVVMVFGTTFR